MHKHLEQGILVVPPQAKGLVVFAHGSGSSRLSPRNQYVADVLQKADLATYLFDLLSEEEDMEYQRRFDIPLLADRLVEATRWVARQRSCAGLPIGFFGASTGSAAALYASLEFPQLRAVVSRGGRPDLAMDVLSQIQASTLLIVGGADVEVLELNKEAYAQLTCRKKLAVVPGATHLFEERGALEQVAHLAQQWFLSSFDH